jgi:hypothetical protein
MLDPITISRLFGLLVSIIWVSFAVPALCPAGLTGSRRPRVLVGTCRHKEFPISI